MRKQLGILLFTACISVTGAFPSLAAWIQEGTGYKYQLDDGSFAAGKFYHINGANYAFDANGNMQTGWVEAAPYWYYFDPASGAQVFGWHQVGGSWYFLEPYNNGIMHTGWLDIGNDRYYFDDSGVMKTGVFYVLDSASNREYAYEANEKGVLTRNVMYEAPDGVVYRYDENGMIQYKSPKNELAAGITEDRDVWLYLMKGDSRDAQNEEVNDLVAYKQYYEMNRCYDRYMSGVKTKTGEDREKAESKWKKETKRSLAGCSMSSKKINDFIEDVENENYEKVDLPADPDEFDRNAVSR